MKRWQVAFVVGAVAASGVTYVLLQKDERVATDKLQQLEQTVTELKERLLGYEKYTDYIAVGKKALGEQSQFLAATVTRQEHDVQYLEKSVVVMKSNAAVVVSYTGEYSFGYDLRPESYDLIKGDGGSSSASADQSWLPPRHSRMRLTRY